MRKLLRFTADDYAEMELRYFAGEPTNSIGRRFDCVGGAIWNHLKKRGIQLRPPGWQARMAIEPLPRWHSHGYVLINGEYEHRLVMEQMLGRKLRPDESVHHKNHRRRDNRPENLELLSASDHARLHGKEHETWTPEEDAELLGMRASGKVRREMAQRFGCSKEVISNRLIRLRKRGYTIPAARAGTPRKTHCKRGHPLIEGNLYHLSSGERVCRTCALTRLRTRRASLRAEALRLQALYESEHPNV